MSKNPLKLREYDTDKFQNGLIECYKKYLSPLKYQPIHLLEIGIFHGGSIRYWDDYLLHADTQITGLDLEIPELSCSDRVKLIAVDQNDKSTLQKIADSLAPLDFIIDDGAHRKTETRNCFEALFDRLKSGGYYAIEDWAVGYMGKGFEEFHGMVDLITDIIKDAEKIGISDFHITLEGTCALAVFRKK